MHNKDMEKDNYKDNAKPSNVGKENRTAEENDSDSSLDNQELINSINYNTITSLAALKDILQGDATNTIEADNFFQHYFLNHCNNLSSRNSISPFHYPERRRLSQCREEDEDNEKSKKESDHPSTSQTKHKSSKSQKNKHNKDTLQPRDDEGEEIASDESMDNDESRKRTVVGVKHKFLVTPTQPKEEALEKPMPPQSHNAHTVHFGTKGVEEIRPNVKTIFDPLNLRRDKKYFDSSLIEIRSQVDELDSTKLNEDIWVKREDPKPKPAKRVVRVAEEPVNTTVTSKGARPRRVSLDDVGRARASSFSSRKDRGIIRKFSLDKKEKKKKSKDDSDGLSWSSQSGTEKQDWGSADDVGNTMYQQTIHGTSGVSRRPALFDSFKSSKKGESRRQTSLIQQVVEAVQNIGKSSEKEEKAKKKEITHETKKENKVSYKPTTRDGSAHPHAGSDAKYYHTMTAGAQRRPSAIAKVMDVFRSRPSSANEAADKRKARAILQQSHQNAGAKMLQDIERRRSLGQLPRQTPIDPYRAAVLARDENGKAVVIPYLDKDSKLSREEDEAQIFVKFFKYHTCYNLMPTSAKLVIFDTKLRVKKAFYALVDNGVRAAPLWDSEHHQFVGMLTITDFIKILQMYYTSPNVTMDELEEHRLETWRDVLRGSIIPLVSIGPQSSLLDAIRILITNKIHRLPVIDPETGDVIHIITHKRILRFLFLYINDIPKPAYLNRKIRDLRIGTLSDIETATEDTLIIEALTKFVSRRISALPVVDAEGRLKDIYAKFDVINLAAEKSYDDLNVTLKQANEHRNTWFEGVRKCTLDETLYEVMKRIVKAEVHRLVVVDEEDRVIGIISLSDLLQYIALRPNEVPVNRPISTLHSASIDEVEENLEDQSEDDTVTKDDSTDTDNTEVADNQDNSSDEDTKTLCHHDKEDSKVFDDNEN